MKKKRIFSITYEESKRDNPQLRFQTESEGEMIGHGLPGNVRKALQRWLKFEIKESRDGLKNLETPDPDEMPYPEEEKEKTQKSAIEDYSWLWRVLEEERLLEKIRDLKYKERGGLVDD